MVSDNQDYFIDKKQFYWKFTSRTMLPIFVDQWILLVLICICTAFLGTTLVVFSSCNMHTTFQGLGYWQWLRGFKKNGILFIFGSEVVLKFFNNRATCFHSQAKLFLKLNFFIRKISSRWPNQVSKIILIASQFKGAQPLMKIAIGCSIVYFWC